jgi:L,D-transpeptidase catalytic domain
MRLSAVVLSLSVAAGLICFEARTSASARTTTARAFASVQSLNNQVLQLALNAATCARESGVVNNDRLLTVIDYSKASTQPRLWVLDLESERVLFEELVAHGQGSGDNYATKFSNQDGTHQTSLGLFRTADTYVGTNGYSLRLDGLEPGVNDHARDRAIVIHGAPYVNAVASRTLGRLGRSWGCPALRPAIARTLIDTIKAGSLVFAYYPDQQWLRGSRFLNGCS